MTIDKNRGLPKAPAKGWKGDWVSGNLGPDAPRNEVHKQNALRFLLTLIAFLLAWALAQMVENPKPKSNDVAHSTSSDLP
jgi:hypothetical protein